MFFFFFNFTLAFASQIVYYIRRHKTHLHKIRTAWFGRPSAPCGGLYLSAGGKTKGGFI
jgi:hypothetical protein